MMRTILNVFACVALLTSGCAFYRPRPLDSGEEWKRLEDIRVEDLAGYAVKGKDAARGPSRHFDYSDGLSIDEAAGLAVVLNPDLRSFRLKQGVAEGQLVGAGLFPNPEVEAKWLSAPGPGAGELNLVFDLTELLLRRGPEKELARIHLKEVRWEIAEREWKLVNQARIAFTDLVYRDEALGLNRTQKGIAEHTLAIIKARKAKGAATELDVILAEADVREIERRERHLAGERKRSLQRLNKLLGLPPNHDTRIQKAKKPLAYIALSGGVRVLAEKIRTQRPDLLAAEQTYLAAEKELHIEHRKQFPRIHVGPSAEREEGRNSFGFGFSIEVPIFNRNRGGIAAGFAERDRKRQSYIALLHEARAELYAAWAEWETLDAELAFYFTKVAPLLDRGLRLTRKAFKEGEIDLLQVLIFQGRVLESKREMLETLLNFHRARIQVEEATGPRIDFRPAEKLSQ